MINPKINAFNRLNIMSILIAQILFFFLSFELTAQTTPPYINGFESETDTVGWTHMASDGVDDWEWGIPDDYYFAPAPEGLKAWGTNLDGDNTLDAQRHLVSPYFDLSNTTINYVLTFQNVRHCTGPIGGFSIEYNIAGSSSWPVLYNASVDKLNWQGSFGYNTNQLSPATAKIDLNWLQGNDSVRFRFTRATYSSTGGEGWEIDDFQIRPEFYNYVALQGDTVFHVTKNFTEIEVESGFYFYNEYFLPTPMVNNYYWSTDQIIDGSDIFLGAVSTNVNFSNTTFTNTFAMPPNQSVGTYYVISSLDVTNNVVESNETDNQNFTVVIIDSLYSTPFITDFEPGQVEWTTAPDPYSWTFGQPDQWHVHSARSGNQAWIAPIEGWVLGQYLETPYIDFTGSTNTSLCLWHFTSGYTLPYLPQVFVEFPYLDDPTVAHPIFYPNTSNPDSVKLKNYPIYDWRCACIDISALDNYPSTKLRIYSSDGTAIDDVYIGPSKPDAAIQGLTDNRFTSTSIASDTLWYTYFNAGMATLNTCETDFYWSTDSLLDGGDIFIGSKTEPLMTDTTMLHTYFLYNKVSTAPGIFYLIANIDADNSIDEMREYDNQKVFKIYQQNTIPLPYYNDFETQITDWRHNASRHYDEWNWGEPQGDQIDSAFSGTKGWHTGTNGFVNDSSRMHLYTPIFDLTQLTNPVLEFDYENHLSDIYTYEYGNIMYSSDGGFNWIPVVPQNNSFKRMYNEISYDWSEGLDAVGGANLNSQILFGYNNQPWFIATDWYQGRDYDETTHFVVDLDYLGSLTQIQFMFVHAKEDPITADGCLIDNFSISESKIDFMVPTDKNIMADSDDASIKFFFSVKNDDNYLSDSSLFYLYCSSDTLIDASDTLFYQGIINPLMPFANQHIVINKPAPSNYGNYSYILYHLDPLNSTPESDEVNNIGYFDLGMDTAVNYEYPLLFDFEEKYIDGWTYYLDSSSMDSGHRFRSQVVTGDIWTVDATSGTWFLDSRWTFWSVSFNPTHYLEGPAFDFTGHTNIHLSFDFLCIGKNSTTGTGSQGANLQYSIDGGVTWQVVTQSLDPGASNWYNLNAVMSLNNEPGWGLIDDWTNAGFDLSFLENEPDVRFRFKFKSTHFPSSTDPNGFRLDNFQISADYQTTLPPITVCEGEGAFIFGNYETDPDVYALNLISVTGLDSIILQELIIFDSIQTIDVDAVCIHEDYTFPDGTIITDVTADVIHFSEFTSNNGCDSIVKTMLYVQTLNTSVIESGTLLTAVPFQGTYQWLDCNNNFAPIPGQTLNTMTMPAPGGYAVEITSSVCTDTSQCYGDFVLEIPEAMSSAVQLYPNPTQGIVYLQTLKPGQEINVRIYNAMGELVLQKNTSTNEVIVLEVNGADGIYLVEVTLDGERIETFRLLKE